MNGYNANYAAVPRDTLIAAAEHNRDAAAYWHSLYQQEQKKNQELMESIAYLTAQLRQVAEGRRF